MTYPYIRSVANNELLAAEDFDGGSDAAAARVKAIRAAALADEIERGRGPAQQDVIECALCVANKLPDVEKQFPAATLEAAHKAYHGTFSIQEALLEASASQGHRVRASQFSSELRPILRAAFSTTALPGALGNAANKFILAAYLSVERGWRKLVHVRSVKDFRPTAGYRLTGDLMFKRIGPDGEISHGSLGEASYSNRASTYARMFSLTREDLVNDDAGIFSQLTKALGRGAGLALNESFWRLFMDNAAFFSAGNKNYIEGAGTALSIDGLTQLEAKFLDQVDEQGHPIGLEAKYLVVPNSLKAIADQIRTSTQLVGGSTLSPANNPHAGKWEVVSSSYLTNANYSGNSSTAYYLLADPEVVPVIDAVFLNGKEEPTVESADADFNNLGVQFRGFYDAGFARADHRGGAKSKGAA